MTDELDPSVPVHLTRAGLLTNGQRNDEWFAESVKRSRRALTLGRAEMDRELRRILDDND